MKVKEIVKITRGRLLSGDPETDIDPGAISTDTRLLKKGDFFIALRGANFDASDFVKEALDKGARGAICGPSKAYVKDSRKILIAVKDTTRALQDIAAKHRSNFKIPVICVTGSNGKTTVKEMIWKILSAKYSVLKNEGTKNNHIGVPQTLLKLKKSHEICVLEVGMNHKGEIRLLGRMARPAIAVITNIGPSHLEFLESLKGVYEAKKEILENIAKGGTVILNGDDPFLARIKNNRLKVVTFGLARGSDFRADYIVSKKGGLTFTVNDRINFRLRLLGLHNVYNALAAIAAASRFRISTNTVKRALSVYKPSYMRLNVLKIKGVTIINDAYNSNPLSMACALDSLKVYPAKSKWVVSGDMLELGKLSAALHEEIGRRAAEVGLKGLITFGGLSKETITGAKKSGMNSNKLWHCSTHDQIAGILKANLEKGDAVLIKGSRGMKMEEVIAKLKK